MKFVIQASNLPLPLWLEIGLTDLSKIGVASAPLASPVPPSLILVSALVSSNVNRCTMLCTYAQLFLSLFTDFFRHLSFCAKKLIFFFFLHSSKKFCLNDQMFNFLYWGFCFYSFIHGYLQVFIFSLVRDASTQ